MIDAKTIWTSPHLPTLPDVAVRLVELSKDPNSEIRDIIETVKTDPAIAARILKVSNSAHFGFSSKITSLDRAVNLLGSTYVTAIALSLYLSETATTKGPYGEHFSSYWLHSVVQATAAEAIGKLAPQGTESLFLAGLMMDLGRLAMLKVIPQEYSAVLDVAQEKQRELPEVEREMLGFDHLLIGEQLMQHWELPEGLVRLVRYHHADAEQLDEHSQADDFVTLTAAAVASAAGDFFCATSKGRALDRLRELTHRFYGFSNDETENFLEKLRPRIDQVGEQFSCQVSVIDDTAALMADASAQLVRLTMREHVNSLQAAARQEATEQTNKNLAVQNQALQQEAMHDPLTGLYSRKFFDETLAKEVHRCTRSASPVGVIFCDIDRFKQLNDTYGHQFGDQVLKQLAEALHAGLRQSDILARYGGDEFVVLASCPTERGLHKLSLRIRTRIEREKFCFRGQCVPVTVSVGATLDIPGRGDTDAGRRLVAGADQAMYESKKNGRNQCRIRSLLGNGQRSLLQRVTQRKFSRWLVNNSLLDLTTVATAISQFRSEHSQIGQLAQRNGLIDIHQVEHILQEQAKNGQRFGEIAVQLGFLDEEQLADLLAIQQENPVDLAEGLVAVGALNREQAEGALQRFYRERTVALQATPEPPEALVATT